MGVSPKKRSLRTYGPPGCPIRISLFARAGRSGFPIFFCGKARTVNYFLLRPTGLHLQKKILKKSSENMRRASEEWENKHVCILKKLRSEERRVGKECRSR